MCLNIFVAAEFLLFKAFQPKVNPVFIFVLTTYIFLQTPFFVAFNCCADFFFSFALFLEDSLISIKEFARTVRDARIFLFILSQVDNPK